MPLCFGGQAQGNREQNVMEGDDMKVSHKLYWQKDVGVPM